MRQFAMLVGSRGVVMNVRSEYVPVYHGFSEGLTPEKMFALVPGSHDALARLAFAWEQAEYATNERTDRNGCSVLARARHSGSPAIVFAHAAATGEVDALADVDSRLFVGVSASSHKLSEVHYALFVMNLW